jgi:hypothetical protein
MGAVVVGVVERALPRLAVRLRAMQLRVLIPRILARPTRKVCLSMLRSGARMKGRALVLAIGMSARRRERAARQFR